MIDKAITTLKLSFNHHEATLIMVSCSMMSASSRPGTPASKDLLRKVDRVGPAWKLLRPFMKQEGRMRFKIDMETGSKGKTESEWETGELKIHRNERDAMILLLLWVLNPENPQQLDVMRKEEIVWPLARKLRAEGVIRKELELGQDEDPAPFPLDEERET